MLEFLLVLLGFLLVVRDFLLVTLEFFWLGLGLGLGGAVFRLVVLELLLVDYSDSDSQRR